MNCPDLESVCAAYFECVLTVEQSRAFHQHLSECEDCLVHCISYQWLLLLLHEEQKHLRQAGR